MTQAMILISRMTER